MRRALILATLIALPLSAPALSAQSPTGPVTFASDLRQYLHTGDKTDRRDVGLTFDLTALTVTPKQKGAAPATIPYAAIRSITYDRRSKVRKMSPRQSPALDHFLTVQYQLPGGAGDFIEIEMEKGVAPRVVATIEARAGQPIVRVGG